MRRALIMVAALVLLLLVLPVAPAGATPPSDVEITVPGFVGPFTATGDVICPAGSVADLAGKAAGFQSGKGFNLQIFKEFTCDDLSGTFVLKLQVRIADGVRFNWTVVDGTGAYGDLHGSGTGFVLLPDTDVYTGKMHVD